MNRRDIRALLEEADPARGVTVARGDADAVLQRAAHDITAYEPRGRIVPPRRANRPAIIAVAVATAAVIAGVVAVSWPDPGERPVPVPAYSAVPGPTACLTDLAGHLAPTAYDDAAGRYEYQHLRMESGVTTRGNSSYVTATWIADVKSWIAADGSGHRLTERGAVSYADQAARDYFTKHPGELGEASFDQALPPMDRPSLPAPDAVVAGPLAAMNRVAELNLGQVPDRAHRAAALRFLAAVDGVTCDGVAQTEAGPGLVVTARAAPGPQPTSGESLDAALVFDERTGELLAHGRAAGQWQTQWLERGRVDG